MRKWQTNVCTTTCTLKSLRMVQDQYWCQRNQYVCCLLVEWNLFNSFHFRSHMKWTSEIWLINSTHYNGNSINEDDERTRWTIILSANYLHYSHCIYNFHADALWHTSASFIWIHPKRIERFSGQKFLVYKTNDNKSMLSSTLRFLLVWINASFRVNKQIRLTEIEIQKRFHYFFTQETRTNL